MIRAFVDGFALGFLAAVDVKMFILSAVVFVIFEVGR